MNRDTGEIKHFGEGEPIPENFIKIMNDEMTSKQKKEKKVSKHDNRSKLGKKFLSDRRKRQLIEKMHKRERRNK